MPSCIEAIKHSRWTMLVPLALVFLGTFTGPLGRALCLIVTVLISMWVIYDTGLAKSPGEASSRRRKIVTGIAGIVITVLAVGVFWSGNRIEAWANRRIDSGSQAQPRSQIASNQGNTRALTEKQSPQVPQQNSTKPGERVGQLKSGKVKTPNAKIHIGQKVSPIQPANPTTETHFPTESVAVKVPQSDEPQDKVNAEVSKTPCPTSSPVAVNVQPGAKWVSTDDIVYGPDGRAIQDCGEIDSKRLQVNPANPVHPPVSRESLALDQLDEFRFERIDFQNPEAVAAWSAKVEAYIRDNVDKDLATEFAAAPNVRLKQTVLAKAMILLAKRIHEN